MPNHIFRTPKLGTALLSFTALSVPASALAQSVSEEPIVLEPIILTAGGFEQALSDAPASVSVISSEELEKGSFTSLTDALREVQGVATTGTANEKDIYIRGLPGQYTLILVDGKRQNTRESRTNGNSGYEQSFIPPVQAIERIEIVRGPMSSLYGSDAMGGVINIITKPVADKWTGSVTTETTLPSEGGFENSRQLSFYASGPIVQERLGLQIWGRKLDQDASSVEGGPDASDDYDITGRLTWQIDNQNELLLEAGRTRITSEEYADLRYQDHDRTHWSLTHKGEFGDMETEFSISQETGERTTFDRDSDTDDFIENIRSPEIRNTVIDAKSHKGFEWHGHHQLTFGGQLLRTVLQDQNPGAQAELPEEERYDEKFSIDQWALYVEDEWRMRDDFALTLGMRYSDHEHYGGQVNPRIYGVWDTTPNLTVKGGISTGYRAPDIRTIAPGYAYTTGGRGCSSNNPPSCGVILGNPDLEPEETTNIEIGMTYEADSFSVSATAFHTKFKNKLQQINTGEPWLDGPQYTAADGSRHHYLLYQNFNVDEAEINGLELAGDWSITPTLSARASYTYTDSEQKTGDFAGFPLARTPEHMASLRFDWATPVDGLDTWISANYHGSEIASGLRIGDDGREVEINGQTGQKYAPYTTVDLGVNYRVTDNATVNAAIYNVLNKEIREEEFRTVEEGRRLWLGLTTSF